MGTQVVFLGPATAGKTSLMLGLTELGTNADFVVDRTLTTRPRRPSEGDLENIFLDSLEFESQRSNMLFTFSTFPTYEYGIAQQAPLRSTEMRMRILTPIFTDKFRQIVKEPVLLCSIAPFNSNPEEVFKSRDPNVDPKDFAARMKRFHKDKEEADAIADIRFQNCEGLGDSVERLGALVLGHVAKYDYIRRSIISVVDKVSSF